MVDCGVSPEYFLDRMEMSELAYLTERQNERYKEQWEQVRMICYYTVASQSVKPVTVSDIIRFPWEQKKQQRRNSELHMEALKQKAIKLAETLTTNETTKD